MEELRQKFFQEIISLKEKVNVQDKQLVFAKEEIKYLLQVKLRGAGDPAKST